MAGAPDPTYNPAMLRGRGVAALVILTALLTTAPYLAANSLAEPGTAFSGFLLNPIDGFSYLAKMRQGAASPLEFKLPYAAEPGPGALLFVYQLLLGLISGLTGVAPLMLYHAARFLGTLAMYACAWILFRRTLESQAAAWAAFALTLIGSGLGWLGAPFGVLANDLLVPESIPFLSGYANSHFALATALMVGAVLLIAYEDLARGWRAGLSFAAGLALAAIQPFATLSVAAAAGVWLVWEARRGAGWAWSSRRLKPLLAFAAGSGPMLVYQLLAIRSHPQLAAWASQNATPTAGLLETALGYGPVLLLAVLAAWRGWASDNPGRRLLLAWAGSGLLLLFAPVALQRRMALGLYLPLAGLAGVGLAQWRRDRRGRAIALAAVVALSLPSQAIVVGAGLRSVAAGEPASTIAEADLDIYRWMADRLPADSLVLAGPVSGNRLPAYADVRVIYGHPFETPDAQGAERRVAELYGWGGDPAAGLDQLRSQRIDYVLFGAEERELGDPTWLDELDRLWAADGVSIYRVPP